MYNVSFRTLVEGPYKGVITWTAFASKEAFDIWNDAKMKEWYEVVEEGISQERCLELGNTDAARLAALKSTVSQISDSIQQLSDALNEQG